MSALLNLSIPGITESATSLLFACSSNNPHIYIHETKELYFSPKNSYQKGNYLHFSLLGIEFIEEMVDNKKRSYSGYLQSKTLNRLICVKNVRTLAKKYNKPSNIREELNASYININKTDISLKLSTRNMLENYYKSDIHKLEIPTGLDCSHWIDRKEQQ